MKPGHESQTAVMVCMARAAAHGRTSVALFSDPTALALLPEHARQRVERFRSGARPKSLRGHLARFFLERRSKMMVARTVAIDNAIRGAASPQVVILGAGLDGRAWRMRELSDVTVFEVDHPDSQRQKRARAAALKPAAREIRFVPIDFAKDRLDDALAAAGHDPGRATAWVWEGVVMYLEQADIEATLHVIEHRSAAKSRLVVAYHSPAFFLRPAGLFLRRIGEPIRSSFTMQKMRALLGRYGFSVTLDEDLPVIAAKLSAELRAATRMMRHLRIATADRVA
jgi:methyltransferase (TIGR00027 family)